MPPTLRLADYDPSWPQRFAAEADRLHTAIGPYVLTIEHVGSTAVPGLLAKPVIDIAVAVVSEDAAVACVPLMAALGYEHRGAHGDDAQRRYFVQNTAGRRDVQVHMYIMPAPAYHEQLRFRDALRTDPALAAAYAAEKRRVAGLVAWDKTAYSVAKGPFIQTVLRQNAAAP